jgi:DNA-binding NtrC family response regulator
MSEVTASCAEGSTEAAPVGFPDIVGKSDTMRALFAEMARVSASDVPVHLFGETGTGKECVARAIHMASSRAGRPFVALNASSLSDDLFESEMFGHAKGAFTGAFAARDGHVAAAEGGTLFLDEVAELTMRAQARLLRFLQEHEYRRLGESVVRRADLRLLTAANVRLEDRVTRGQFRLDLLFRLNVVTLTLPPLRERGEDLLLLARRFLRQAAALRRVPIPELPRDVTAALMSCSWPGNVRQLQNEMSRLVTLAAGGPLRPELLSPGTLHGTPRPIALLRQARAEFERQYLRGALERHGGNRTRTAVALGLSRQGLSLLLSRHGL